MECLVAHRLAQAVDQRPRIAEYFRVIVGEVARRRHRIAAVLGDHGQHPLAQIAQIVGEVPVHPVHHRLVRKIAVIAERHLAHQEIAHGIKPVGFDELMRVDHIAGRFGYLLAFIGPPAMGKDTLRRRQSGGHQEGRPVNRMEAQDILADHVQIGRPESAEQVAIGIRVPHSGYVVGQRVEPDIHDVVVIARHRHAPVEGGARDGQVPQPALHKADHLIAA